MNLYSTSFHWLLALDLFKYKTTLLISIVRISYCWIFSVHILENYVADRDCFFFYLGLSATWATCVYPPKFRRSARTWWIWNLSNYFIWGRQEQDHYPRQTEGEQWEVTENKLTHPTCNYFMSIEAIFIDYFKTSIPLLTLPSSLSSPLW